MKEKPLLSIVSPCYNEEATMRWSVEQLSAKLLQLQSAQKIHPHSFICLVDDGSTDNTWNLIDELSQEHPIVGIKLIANVGHQNALVAGLHYVSDKCDCSISIDIDLQDDLKAMDAMLEQYKAASHIVLGVKMNRPYRSFRKRILSALYYRMLPLLGIRCVVNHSDYRLLSQKSMLILSNMKERHISLRGVFTNLPLPYSVVKYYASKRSLGSSRYTLRKSFKLAWDGISSYSIAPLRYLTVAGLVIFMLSLSYSVYALWIRLFSDDTVAGWASIVIPIYTLGGLILFSLGIVGEYIGKIYIEIKQRPLYFVEKIIGGRNEWNDPKHFDTET